jgi:hypothetical protein
VQDEPAKQAKQKTLKDWTTRRIRESQGGPRTCARRSRGTTGPEWRKPQLSKSGPEEKCLQIGRIARKRSMSGPSKTVERPAYGGTPHPRPELSRIDRPRSSGNPTRQATADSESQPPAVPQPH